MGILSTIGGALGAVSSLMSIVKGDDSKEDAKQMIRSNEIDNWRNGVLAYLDRLRDINPLYVAQHKGVISQSYGDRLAEKMGIEPPPTAKVTNGGAFPTSGAIKTSIWDSDPSNQ